MVTTQPLISYIVGKNAIGKTPDFFGGQETT